MQLSSLTHMQLSSLQLWHFSRDKIFPFFSRIYMVVVVVVVVVEEEEEEEELSQYFIVQTVWPHKPKGCAVPLGKLFCSWELMSCYGRAADSHVVLIVMDSRMYSLTCLLLAVVLGQSICSLLCPADNWKEAGLMWQQREANTHNAVSLSPQTKLSL